MPCLTLRKERQGRDGMSEEEKGGQVSGTEQKEVEGRKWGRIGRGTDESGRERRVGQRKGKGRLQKGRG